MTCAEEASSERRGATDYKIKMVLKVLAQLMARHGGTVIRSVSEAYKRVVAGGRSL